MRDLDYMNVFYGIWSINYMGLVIEKYGDSAANILTDKLDG